MAEAEAKKYWQKGWLAKGIDQLVAWIWTGKSGDAGALMKAQKALDEANAKSAALLPGPPDRPLRLYYEGGRMSKAWR
ncbi:uncharacterized protein N7483_001462 [Penicillium malachiteum]|uniref:uncharacterized protein n=1 Tax=Penicillium malachiteum TaxID=1324776 RepID=UPI002547A838|nr:uncharacterized protein N7483_001462 [Penicillium malachiteum]KAJ5736337.1 hypothetical protein N7483_001462 [Penicillium malachiteum]